VIACVRGVPTQMLSEVVGRFGLNRPDRCPSVLAEPVYRVLLSCPDWNVLKKAVFVAVGLSTIPQWQSLLLAADILIL